MKENYGKQSLITVRYIILQKTEADYSVFCKRGIDLVN